LPSRSATEDHADTPLAPLVRRSCRRAREDVPTRVCR
jgi:hypothetical protein